MLSDQQIIELFHLLFLRGLKSHLDSSLYAIKGGCNLRFFFESIRYSEDIDFDVKTISLLTLKSKIEKILKGQPLKQGLAIHGLSIEQMSSPKQTPTVQRWKVAIKAQNRTIPIPTKIEFSRRALSSEIKAEPIGSFILQTYQLPPLIMPHYLLQTAIEQKIDALVNRTETQARDVFDLHFLFAKRNALSSSFKFDLEKAIDNLCGISFEDFSSQVVTYLLPDYVEYYRSPDIWSNMQLSVIENLKKMKTT